MIKHSALIAMISIASVFACSATTWTSKQPEKKDKYPKEKFHIAFSTNPYNFIADHEVLGVVDFWFPHTSHEVRIMMANNSPLNLYPTSVGGTISPLYTGYQLSYTPKFLHRTSKHSWFYVGLQGRYSYRDFAPYQVTILPYNVLESQTKPTPVNLKANSTAYDGTIMFGSMLKFGHFFADYYIGLGVGYKGMNYQNLDVTKYVIVDPDQLHAKRWNTEYIPLRAGLRIGFVL